MVVYHVRVYSQGCILHSIVSTSNIRYVHDKTHLRPSSTCCPFRDKLSLYYMGNLHLIPNCRQRRYHHLRVCVHGEDLEETLKGSSLSEERSAGCCSAEVMGTRS
jgi:hypothetical protein